MSYFLFDEFEPTSSTAWKQKIQVELNGKDYNETLLWKTPEGIIVKPFYTFEDKPNLLQFKESIPFNICQSIFIDNEKIANKIAKNALKKGANAIEFIAQKPFNFKTVLDKITLKKTLFYFKLNFLDDYFTNELYSFINSKNCFLQIDIIGNLAETGNWFSNLNKDHAILNKIIDKTHNSLHVNACLYQNAGASITQQLAYALAHGNEYLTYFGSNIAKKIHFSFAVGSNYFFEIAKLKAFRILWNTLLKEYGTSNENTHIFAEPSLRNKTIFDYNVNMLRTTTECMSAIFGKANTIKNYAYDSIFNKKNEFGERISRNQLLILQNECSLNDTSNVTDGAYYIENITYQLAEKALKTFKEIEKSGGFLSQLKKGTIQRKIEEKATEEQNNFEKKELILLGANFLQNNNETIKKDQLKIFPFLKSKNNKTLIKPIIKKRLSEKLEKQNKI